jgi:hypothetical protein
MIRDAIFKPKPTEPPVGQVKLNLLTQTPFRADRIAVANQQHPDHQLRIDRRAARMTVKRQKLGAQPAQVKDAIKPTQQMIMRNTIFYIEFVKQTVLLPNLFTQHHHSLCPISTESGNHASRPYSTEFFNSLGYNRTWTAMLKRVRFSAQSGH